MTLEYPLGARNQQHVMLSAYEYGLPGIENARTVSEISAKPIWTAYLYIPAELGDGVAASWEPEQILTATSAAGGKASANWKDITKGVLKDLAVAGDNKFAGGSVRAQVAATSGTLLRPNDTLVLSGVGHNSITFAWTMSPQNAAEAAQIKDLIINFKNAGRPKMKADYPILQYPPIFNVYIKRSEGAGQKQSRKGEQKDLFSYRNMVMESFSVTYGGGANEALFYHDGSPMLVTIQIQMKSIYPGFYFDGNGETTG